MDKNKKSNTTIEIDETTIEPRFSIRGMELLDFTFIPHNNVQPVEFQFDAQVNQEVSMKDKMLFSKITLGIKDEKSVVLGNLSLRCSFEIENLELVMSHKPSAAAMVLKLNQVTISTARGAMFVLFRGTILHNAILPIVDAQALKST